MKLASRLVLALAAVLACSGSEDAPVSLGIDRSRVVPLPDDLVPIASTTAAEFSVKEALLVKGASVKDCSFMWYLDFVEGASKRPVASNVGDPSLSLLPCSPEFSVLQAPGSHVLELFVLAPGCVISDGPNGRVVTGPNGSPATEGEYVTVYWLLEFHAMCD
jgi:hypothetical protein